MYTILRFTIKSHLWFDPELELLSQEIFCLNDIRTPSNVFDEVHSKVIGYNQSA